MNPAQIEVRLLQAVEAIERLGRLTEAAEAIGLSQPALSHALARLRMLFDDPVFIRTPTGMKPTPRGAALAASARRILTLMQSELGSVADFDPALMDRRLTVAMSDVGEMVFLPRLLAHLRSFAPRAGIVTRTLPPRQLIDALDGGTVDLAVGYHPALDEAALERRALFERGYLCLVAADHPRLGRGPLTLDDFLRESHVVVTAEGGVEQVFERHLKQLGLRRSIMLWTPHMFSVPTIVRASDLVATVPHSVGQSLIDDPGLRVVDAPVDTPKIAVAQYWSRRFDRDPAVVWLRDLVAELFAY